MKRFSFIVVATLWGTSFFAQELPTRVNNAKTAHFRNIFSQKNNECTQAAGIGYLFTYEMNVARGVDAASDDHKYPTHFSYNYLNNANGANTALSDEAFTIAIDMGIPNITTYGGMNPLKATGWMTGYEKYYHAMQNRAKEWFSISPLNNEATLLDAKKWLYNHNGQSDTPGGLLVMNTFMGGWKFKTIPAGSYEAGKKIGYIPQVVTTNGHTMTYVGYDDSIAVDLNNDGEITNDKDITGDGVVNMKDWEKGAFIVANSHGLSWQNNGFCYWMYSAAALHPQGVYGLKVLADYHPTHTIKVKLTSSKRKRITIKAGISTNLEATNLEQSKTFSAFQYKKGGDIAMIDNGNNEPIEIGLDISDLFLKVGNPDEAKVFLQIVADKQAGMGEIVSMSCLRYKDGSMEEFLSTASNVSITSGETTTVSALMAKEKEQIHSPGAPLGLHTLNLLYNQITLQWQDTSVLESGFEIERSQNQNGPFNLIETVGINASKYTDMNVEGHQTYYYRICATNNVGRSAYTHVVSTTPTISNISEPLNDEWTSIDLGDMKKPSLTTFSNDTFYISSGDGDIWNTNDAFHFVYKKLVGDGEIITQITAFEGIQAYTMAGIMMRETLEPSSTQASMLIIDDPGTVFRRRLTKGGITGQMPHPNNKLDAPYWLKLVREGNLFEGYHSHDGISWTFQESHTIEMQDTIYMGLATSSHVAESSSKFEFAHVQTSQVNTAISRQEIIDLSIYPNPAGQYIHIKWNESKPLKIEIIDLNGKVVYSEKLLSSKVIDLDQLNNGVHLLRVTEINSNRVKATKLRIIK